jgi:hypothetical protein
MNYQTDLTVLFVPMVQVSNVAVGVTSWKR